MSNKKPAQLVKPVTQTTWHAPPVQTWPEAHVRPQAPQLPRSLVRSRQTPAQDDCPVGQTT